MGPWDERWCGCFAWVKDHGVIWTKRSKWFGRGDANGDGVQASNPWCFLHSTTSCITCAQEQIHGQTLSPPRQVNTELAFCPPSSPALLLQLFFFPFIFDNKYNWRIALLPQRAQGKKIKNLHFSRRQVFPPAAFGSGAAPVRPSIGWEAQDHLSPFACLFSFPPQESLTYHGSAPARTVIFINSTNLANS